MFGRSVAKFDFCDSKHCVFNEIMEMLQLFMCQYYRFERLYFINFKSFVVCNANTLLNKMHD